MPPRRCWVSCSRRPGMHARRCATSAPDRRCGETSCGEKASSSKAPHRASYAFQRVCALCPDLKFEISYFKFEISYFKLADRAHEIPGIRIKSNFHCGCMGPRAGALGYGLPPLRGSRIPFRIAAEIQQGVRGGEVHASSGRSPVGGVGLGRAPMVTRTSWTWPSSARSTASPSRGRPSNVRARTPRSTPSGFSIAMW